MTLEPLYLSVILSFAVLSTVWVFVAVANKNIKGLAYKLITFITSWVFMFKYSVVPKLMYFAKSDVSSDYKTASFLGGLLIVLDIYVAWKLITAKFRTNWNDRFHMFVLFGLSQGLMFFWTHYMWGTVCSSFTVWIQMCTDYPAVAKLFIPFAVVGYWLMTILTNDENTRSVVSTFGHMVADSKEGIDFVPELLINLALFLKTIGLKNLFEISGHMENKSYAVIAEALQFSSDGLQVIIYLGAGFEIDDYVKFRQVGPEFAIAMAQQDLTSTVALMIANKPAKKAHELKLSLQFIDDFNRVTDPVKRYGLRMVSASPLKADYYDPTTRAFFNELGTMNYRGDYLGSFMEEAKAAYDKLSLEFRSRFTFKECVAVFLSLSGKGSTFGQIGINRN